MADDGKKYTIRMSDELHAQLKAIAQQDARSLHQQILVILREAVQRSQSKPDQTKEDK